MGQAKARGTKEQREAQAKAHQDAEDAEVFVFFKHAQGQLNVQFIARDEEPDQSSPAVILASYLQSNLDQLVKESLVAYKQFMEQSKEEKEEEKPLRLLNPNGGWVN